jgi:hypothetical protein
MRSSTSPAEPPAARPDPQTAPRSVRLIVIHCTGTPNGDSLFRGERGHTDWRTPADVVDERHAARGYRRESYWTGRQNSHLSHIGFHALIGVNGALSTGRHWDEPGQHADGWDHVSIAVAMVGTDQFTAPQWATLRGTLEAMSASYGVPLMRGAVSGSRVVRRGILGHRDLPGVAERCPGFDVWAWLKGGLEPLPDHVAPALPGAPALPEAA